MTRRSLIGTGVLLVLVIAGLAWLWWRPALLPPADSRQDTMPDMPGMASQSRPMTEEPRPNPRPESSAVPSELPGIVTVPVERLQMIGVKYQSVARRPLEKVIRPSGVSQSTNESWRKSPSSFTAGSKSCL